MKERLLVLLSPRPRFRTSDEVFAAADRLIRELEDGGFSAAAASARRGFCSLNGLTDGWYDFKCGLEKAESELPLTAGAGVRKKLRELVAAARYAVYR